MRYLSKFPKAVTIDSAVRWSMSDVQDWLRDLKRQRDEQEARIA